MQIQGLEGFRSSGSDVVIRLVAIICAEGNPHGRPGIVHTDHPHRCGEYITTASGYLRLRSQPPHAWRILQRQSLYDIFAHLPTSESRSCLVLALSCFTRRNAILNQ